MRSLHHENVVACYGCVQVTDETGRSNVQFVLEYCPRGTLREHIRLGQYNAMQAFIWLLDVAQGMAYLHHDACPGVHLAHRDLKPENVLISEIGHAKIADFGLAKVVEIVEGSSHVNSRRPSIRVVTASRDNGRSLKHSEQQAPAHLGVDGSPPLPRPRGRWRPATMW